MMEDVCVSSVTAEEYPVMEDEDGNISFPLSEDAERRNIGYIIAALAYKYIVYHEISHHTCGHLEQMQDVLGLDSGEAGLTMKQMLSPDDYKFMEMEADIEAVKMILEEFHELEQKWNPYFDVELEHLELAHLLVVALVIVKGSLSGEVLSFEDIERSRYFPKLLRMIVGIYAVIANDGVLNSFKDALERVPEMREFVEQKTGPISLDDRKNLIDGLTVNLSSVAGAAQLLYADIFWGTHDLTVFRDDIMAGQWWNQLE